VQGTGTPVVLVLLSGSALAVGWADEHVPAIVQAWYPGSEGGRAVASLLFGGFSPSGRLPVTFYRTTEELPDFRDYAMAGRTYRYMDAVPLYPFGFGLGYSTFEYGDVALSAATIRSGESLSCSVAVRNTGDRDAEETVQLYLQDVEASVRTPRWQLCGIRKIRVEAGGSREVTFELAARQMALIDEEGMPVLEPGRFRVHVGGSQPDARSLELGAADVSVAEFVVEGERLVLPY